jgi:hypothetical protein
VDLEASLRARYAVAFTKFKLGPEDGLIDELAEVAARYEQTLADASIGSRNSDARQGSIAFIGSGCDSRPHAW